ncbi:hypothetical protein H8D36_02395 [archaeon]|nr:hypothetical protein [archaeon]MBL7057223.1 hypothetical protein [Candidatus Woesearchaeota archaeon]
MKKLWVLGVLLVLASLLTTAMPIYEKGPINVTNAYPEIIVEYDEPVTIHMAYIWKLPDEFNVSYSSADNTTFNMFAEEYLMNGDYTLYIISQDGMGNPSQVVQPFTVEAPYMSIDITSPHLGVSSEEVFDVEITTGSDSECKYSMFFVEPPQMDNFHLLFDVDEGTNHTILGINTDNSFSLFDESPDEDGFHRTFHVKCVDENNLIHPKSLYIANDPSPPVLGVSITPNPITDPQEPMATLTVLSSDRSICSYTENGEYKTFEGYDLENFSAYKKEHTLALDFSDLALREGALLFQQESFQYDIRCTNLAGFESALQTATLTVAFNEEFAIVMNEPGEYTNDDSTEFEIETSIQTLGGCKYGESSPNQNFTTIYSNKIYSVELGLLDEGEYSYETRCVGYGDQRKSFSFTVDRTDPENLTVDVQDPTCSLSTISGTFSAEDEISGIDYYNYTIVLGAEIIGEGSSGSTFSKSVELSENETYRISVAAYDNAGNYEEDETTIIAKSSSSSECDFNPPTTSIETRATSEGMLIDVQCFDSGSGCKNSFTYGLAGGADSCVVAWTELITNSIITTEDQTFCWTVYDTKGNNASGSEFVEFLTPEEAYPIHCFNELPDDTETDIDCGGDCPPCGAAAACTSNNDCISKACDPLIGQCIEPSCNNLHKDGYETDIDCGGDCEQCEAGFICSGDGDCISGICKNNFCSEDLDIDSDGDGMPDYWEIQYELKPADPSDADEDPDGDELTNLEEFRAGSDPRDKNSPRKRTDDTPPSMMETDEEGKSIIPMIFMVVGLIFVIFGIIYLILENKKKKQGFASPRLIDNKGLKPIMEPSAEEKKTKEWEESTFEKKSDVRKEKRKEIFSKFKRSEPRKNEHFKIDSKTEEAAKKTFNKEPKKGETKKEDEYVDVSTLKEKEENLEKENLGKDVFQELELIKKQASVDEESEEHFAVKEKEEEKKIELEEEEKLPLKLEDEKTEEDENIVLESDDIFKKLAALAGKDHEEVKKAVDKKEVSSADILKVFANVTSKKQIDANVFKAILSELLTKGKLSKQTVAEILFEFLDTELLTKKEVSELLKELELTGK